MSVALSYLNFNTSCSKTLNTLPLSMTTIFAGLINASTAYSLTIVEWDIFTRYTKCVRRNVFYSYIQRFSLNFCVASIHFAFKVSLFVIWCPQEINMQAKINENGKLIAEKYEQPNLRFKCNDETIRLHSVLLPNRRIILIKIFNFGSKRNEPSSIVYIDFSFHFRAFFPLSSTQYFSLFILFTSVYVIFSFLFFFGPLQKTIFLQ